MPRNGQGRRRQITAAAPPQVTAATPRRVTAVAAPRHVTTQGGGARSEPHHRDSIRTITKAPPGAFVFSGPSSFDGAGKMPRLAHALRDFPKPRQPPPQSPCRSAGFQQPHGWSRRDRNPPPPPPRRKPTVGATQVATTPQSHRTLVEGPCRSAGFRQPHGWSRRDRASPPPHPRRKPTVGATQVATMPQSQRTPAEDPCRSAGRRDLTTPLRHSPQAPVGATEVATNHDRRFRNRPMRQRMWWLSDMTGMIDVVWVEE